MLTPQEFDQLLRAVYEEEEVTKYMQAPTASLTYRMGLCDLQWIEDDGSYLQVLSDHLDKVLEPKGSTGSAVLAYELGCFFSDESCECCEPPISNEQWAEENGVGEYFHLGKKFAEELARKE